MIRRTLIGFAAGALVFALLGMWMNVQIGEPLFSNPGPVGIWALIGGTTAGLVSPMFGRRRRGPRTESADGPPGPKKG